MKPIYLNNFLTSDQTPALEQHLLGRVQDPLGVQEEVQSDDGQANKCLQEDKVCLWEHLKFELTLLVVVLISLLRISIRLT